MTFVPGLELSRAFYVEVVRPILADVFPGLDYAAALIGSGSEVLGFDSERSTDHHWGPRVMLFVSGAAIERTGAIEDALSRRLPGEFRGYSTHFGPADRVGVRLRQAAMPGEPVAHRVEVHERGAYFAKRLGFDPLDATATMGWLATPSQVLLELTSGAVFEDGDGELTRSREALLWYPRDVWLYMMACQWQRIAEQEAFAGRCAEAGDEMGSRLIAARIVRDVMRLCFLIERRYAPYDKWLGTAFSRLSCASTLDGALNRVLDARVYVDREAALCEVYESVAQMHNELGVTPNIDVRCRLYYDRPYRVLRADRFAVALREGIADVQLRTAPLVGAIDQFTDNVAATGSAGLRARFVAAFVDRD